MARKRSITLAVIVIAAAAGGAGDVFCPAFAQPPVEMQQKARSTPVLPVSPAQNAHQATRLDYDWQLEETPSASATKSSVTGRSGLCGMPPATPAIAQASALSAHTAEVAHEVVIGSLKEIKAYQASLGSFRTCLLKYTLEYKAALVEAKARQDEARASLVKWWMDELRAAYDRTIDEETAVVTAYMELHNAYCRMGGGLRGCAMPRPQQYEQ